MVRAGRVISATIFRATCQLVGFLQLTGALEQRQGGGHALAHQGLAVHEVQLLVSFPVLRVRLVFVVVRVHFHVASFDVGYSSEVSSLGRLLVIFRARALGSTAQHSLSSAILSSRLIFRGSALKVTHDRLGLGARLVAQVRLQPRSKLRGAVEHQRTVIAPTIDVNIVILFRVTACSRLFGLRGHGTRDFGASVIAAGRSETVPGSPSTRCAFPSGVNLHLLLASTLLQRHPSRPSQGLHHVRVILIEIERLEFNRRNDFLNDRLDVFLVLDIHCLGLDGSTFYHRSQSSRYFFLILHILFTVCFALLLSVFLWLTEGCVLFGRVVVAGLSY